MRLLTSEQLAALKNHQALERVRAGAFLLQALPDGVTYAKGKLSLVPDLRDRDQGEIAIFLINDTSKSIPGVVFEYTEAVEEVKIGRHWRRCQPFGYQCGSVEPPQDLPPGQALLLRGPDPTIGDLEGEIRYSLESPDLVSQTIRGRYSSKAYSDAGLDHSSNGGIAGDIVSGLIEGKWELCEIAKNPEEINAALVLERSYDESWASRLYASRWLRKHYDPETASDEERKCAARMKQVFSVSWNRALDVEGRLRRCLSALDSCRPVSHQIYGTPEKCRAVVWRYLNRISEHHGLGYLTIEQRAEARARVDQGNPLGATMEQLILLKREAENSFEHGDEAERAAATWFLCFDWWPHDLIPDDEIVHLLNSGTPATCLWPIQVLSAKGQREVAVEWLFKNLESLNQDAADRWVPTLWGKDPVLGDADLRLFHALLARNHFEGVGTFSRVQQGWHEHGVPEWSGKFRVELRAALERELHENSVQGMERPDFDVWGEPLPLTPPNQARRQDLGHLSGALAVLAAWENPEDTPLIKSFLHHPGVSYRTINRNQTFKCYEVRSEVVGILKKREGKDAANGVILEEPLLPNP